MLNQKVTALVLSLSLLTLGGCAETENDQAQQSFVGVNSASEVSQMYVSYRTHNGWERTTSDTKQIDKVLQFLKSKTFVEVQHETPQASGDTPRYIINLRTGPQLSDEVNLDMEASTGVLRLNRGKYYRLKATSVNEVKELLQQIQAQS